MSAAPPIRVLVADDHPLIRDGLGAVIEGEPDLVLVASVASGEAAVAEYRALRPDVVLMDLRMPGMGGSEATRAIRRAFPDARVLALTTYDGDADIQRALDAGARGYLLKDMLAAEVLDAVRAVARGRRVVPAAVGARLAEGLAYEALTPREAEALALLARGLRNKEIARVLGCSEATAKVHVKHVLGKLGANDRTEAVAVAARRGLVHLG